MRTAAAPLRFLTLVAALSLPLYLLGALTGGLRIGSLTLPSSAVMFLLPALVAGGLTWRAGGRTATFALLRRTLDRPPAAARWYLVAALLFPAIAAVTYLGLRWTGRVDGTVPLPWFAAPVVIALFLWAATCEELGWTAYATAPLQQRFGPAAAGLGLGLYWAIWHLPGWLQAGRSVAWIAGWFLVTVAARILIVQLYNRTDAGVTTAILLHTSLNVVSAYLPGLDEPITTLTLGLLTAVAALLGSRAVRSAHPSPNCNGGTGSGDCRRLSPRPDSTG